MERVRWAVVGTSDFALDWIARGVSLGSNAELVAVVSRDEARAAAAATRVGAPRHYTSIEAIEREAVDGVFLVLPNPQHAPYAIAAARRGLHVIVEKPMAPTLDECRAMIAAAREAGVVLAVAQCMEWAPPVVKARELVEAGVIGKPLTATISASWNSPAPDPWRQSDTTEAGGGPLHDAGVHALDTIQRILGPVTRVACELDHLRYSYVAEDASTTLLRFASGAHGVMHAHFNCNQNWLEIIGTEGRLWSEQWLGREFSGKLHLQRGQELTSFDLPTVNVYKPQIEDVSAAVLGRGSPTVTGERGAVNIAVIEAAIRSARSGAFVDVAVGL
ncbi:MAG: 1,5-anhydro-D-fructose reductase [Chloroflexota bacterium]|jgi:1,5-anhydro-D-fructose reductase (1,5-anhydro-D-mannitol-forming)